MLCTRLSLPLHMLEDLVVLLRIMMNFHKCGGLLGSHLACVLTVPLPCSLTTALLYNKNLWVDGHPNQVLMLVIVPRLMIGKMELSDGHRIVAGVVLVLPRLHRQLNTWLAQSVLWRYLMRFWKVLNVKFGQEIHDLASFLPHSQIMDVYSLRAYRVDLALAPQCFFLIVVGLHQVTDVVLIFSKSCSVHVTDCS